MTHFTCSSYLVTSILVLAVAWASSEAVPHMHQFNRAECDSLIGDAAANPFEFDASFLKRLAVLRAKYPDEHAALITLAGVLKNTTREEAWRQFKKRDANKLLSNVPPRDSAGLVMCVASETNTRPLISPFVNYGDASVSGELLICQLASPVLRDLAMMAALGTTRSHSVRVINELARVNAAFEKPDVLIEVLAAIWQNNPTEKECRDLIGRWEATDRVNKSLGTLIASARQAYNERALTVMDTVTCEKIAESVKAIRNNPDAAPSAADLRTLWLLTLEVIHLLEAGRKDACKTLLNDAGVYLGFDAQVRLLRAFNELVETDEVAKNQLDFDSLMFGRASEEEKKNIAKVFGLYVQLDFDRMKWDSITMIWNA